MSPKQETKIAENMSEIKPIGLGARIREAALHNRFDASSEEELGRSTSTSTNSESEAGAKDQMSWLTLCFVLVAELLGIGITAMPDIIATWGIASGLGVLIPTALSSLLTSTWAYKYLLQHPEIRSMGDVAACMCPRFARMARTAASIMIVLLNLAIMSAHLCVNISIAETWFNGIELPGNVRPGLIMLAPFLVICFSLTALRNPERLAKFGILTGGCVVAFAIAITALLSQAQVPDHGKQQGPYTTTAVYPWYNHETSRDAKLVAVLKLVFIYLVQTTIPSLMPQMKKPEQFWKSLYVTFAILTFVLGGFGVSVCTILMQRGMRLPSPVWESLPRGHGQAASAILLLPSTVQAVIYCLLIVQFIHDGGIATSLAQRFRLGPRVSHGIVSGLLWILAGVVAILVPQFKSLLAIIGAVFGGIFVYLIWSICLAQMHFRSSGDWRNAGTLHLLLKLPRLVLLLFALAMMGVCFWGCGPTGAEFVASTAAVAWSPIRYTTSKIEHSG
ncbi:transmembrane amino acid transporter protein-domain-containing protein [Emericellopsis atlantica]|uniref:Transmembrane amino acid transporter protein-domain-containing protein n=1 Tax=Emericellopsis atlantica TaxID=2614577 RepID=A0A9P8CPR9_9HYPO|nr:transmembrane amino acid transporter protein-domain-containing protein [Emericellopsis atlantica]KAG9253036.1 transmembrane amino acid transporter protein-domain-containing protein [Emericellopsis atlantica]